MIINIVTIGNTPHALWCVNSSTIKVGGVNRTSFFLESSDKKVLQKIKLGGAIKQFPNDGDFNSDMVSEGTMVRDGNISIQEIEIPFGQVFINTRNMNPYLADLNGESNDRILILLLGNDYSYVRSNTNHSVGEIICTFHTDTSIGCIMRISEDIIKEMQEQRVNEDKIENKDASLDVNLMMLDTYYNKEFNHFRINFDTKDNTDCITVAKSVVKKPDLVKRLSGINNKFDEKKTARRFVRFTPNLITSYYIYPSTMSDDDLNSLVYRHGMSKTLGTNVPLTFLPVNVNDSGYIIKDDDLKETIEELKNDKVKAFTLVNCKIGRDTFEAVKPLYIFSFDETENLSKSDDVKNIKCIKNN